MAYPFKYDRKRDLFMSDKITHKIYSIVNTNKYAMGKFFSDG